MRKKLTFEVEPVAVNLDEAIWLGMCASVAIPRAEEPPCSGDEPELEFGCLRLLGEAVVAGTDR
jgi:hypothetical protein